jgi:4-amino-4-deoxy-L-arabinose transferase-like glycosyltransferase
LEVCPEDKIGCASPKREINWRILAAVGALMLLTAALRAYRLDEQSVWYDEYHSAVHVEAPDLMTYMTVTRQFNQEHVPLYYVAEYFWAQIFGTAPTNLRWLSILFNVLTVPLLCGLGRRLFNPRAGLMAGLFFALSPMQIWHGQSLRPYAMVVLMAAVSMHTLVWAVQEGKAWCWLAHGVSNALLMWTHPFGVLALAGMAPAFLFMERKRCGSFLLWGAGNAAALFSVWLYFRSMPYLGEDAYVWFQPPDLKLLLFNLAGNDALMRLELYTNGATWPWVPSALAAALMRARAVSDWVLLAAGLLMIVWLALGLRGKNSPKRRVGMVFVLGVLVVPGLALLVLTYVWRPCFMPRYTLYSALPLHLALGGAISGISVSALRRTALVGLAGVYMLQLAFVLPAATRTDWHGMFRYLSAQAKQGDMVANVGGMPPSTLLFTYRARQSGYARLPEPVYNLYDLCEKTERFFADEKNADASVWAVYDQAYQWGPNRQYLDCFGRRGYALSFQEFIVQENIIVYRIRRGVTGGPPIGDCRDCAPDDSIYEKILATAGIFRSDPAAWEPAVASLRGLIDTEIPPDKQWLAMVGICLVDAGRPELGKRFAEASIKLAPEFGLGEMALGFALQRLGDTGGAEAAFERGFAWDAFFSLYRPLVKSLCETGASERTRAEAARLNRMGVETPMFLSR